VSPSRHVLVYTDTAAFGGAERALLTLVEGLGDKGWRPTLAYHPGDGVAPLVESAKSIGAELWPVPSHRDGMSAALGTPRFSRQLRARRPDVFHAQVSRQPSCRLVAAAVGARVPAIVATHQFFIEGPNPAHSRLGLQQRMLARFVDKHIAVSQDVESRLRDVLA
jgi:hypothetical protein